MNKKAFTLIEIMAIILILGSIFLVSYPSLESMLKKEKTTKKNSANDTYIKAAKTYFNLNSANYDFAEGSVLEVSLDELKEADLIEKMEEGKRVSCKVIESKKLECKIIKGLPKTYQRVEWIKSDGSAYILTDYIPQNPIKAIFDVILNETSSGDKMIFGIKGTNNSYYFEFYQSTNTSKRIYAANGYAKYSNSIFSSIGFDKFHIVMDSNNIQVAEEAKTPSTYYTKYKIDIPMAILSWNNEGTIQYIDNIRSLCDLIFEENNVVVRHYVPCYRKSDGKIGLFDLVNGKFWENSGTGQFEKGPDVN